MIWMRLACRLGASGFRFAAGMDRSTVNPVEFFVILAEFLNVLELSS
ncbi:hypothetical protein BH11PSE11_BH11PSE11_07760 [soil metagenome]